MRWDNDPLFNFIEGLGYVELLVRVINFIQSALSSSYPSRPRHHPPFTTPAIDNMTTDRGWRRECVEGFPETVYSVCVRGYIKWQIPPWPSMPITNVDGTNCGFLLLLNSELLRRTETSTPSRFQPPTATREIVNGRLFVLPHSCAAHVIFVCHSLGSHLLWLEKTDVKIPKIFAMPVVAAASNDEGKGRD